ncbi:hypothetical protein [Neptuniibacter halophilus]|uniref:hypothetical protein n=1 Tax=Neptuniibacter halophilus TaxID=651666 RepID=UPI0025746853|nr:hypothetical protein [Neptuniibacter halophilus]
MIRPLTLLGGLTGLMISAGALAHYPMMECAAQSEMIECRVGFSDGSKATGKPVRLYDYDENLIAEAEADQRSLVSFSQPQGEFYIQFDSGHEFPVEVDYGEL